MMPLAVKKGLGPTIQRFANGLSEQLKRFLIRGEAKAAHAASGPAGPVFKKMPLFSSILEEAQTTTETTGGKDLAQFTHYAMETKSSIHLASKNSNPHGSVQQKTIYYKVQPGDTLWALGVKRFHVHPEDIAKENNIKDPRALKPGQVIKVTLPKYTGSKRVVASWYGKEHHGKLMANGEPFNMYAATIAHKELPLGTRVELTNPKTGQRVVATVTDRGPYIDGREVDLSYGLARKLDMVERGVGELIMRVIG